MKRGTENSFKHLNVILSKNNPCSSSSLFVLSFTHGSAQFRVPAAACVIIGFLSPLKSRTTLQIARTQRQPVLDRPRNRQQR